MRNEHVAVSTGRRAEIVAGRFTLLSFLLAGALIACGGSPANGSLTVSPATASIARNIDQQFVATRHDADGTSTTLTSVTWSSSSDAIATVDSLAGLAHGVATGPAVTITATDTASGLSGTASLTVTGAELQFVTVLPATASIPVGLGRQFTATGHFSDGTNPTLTSGVTWSSSNNAVATMNGSGVALGVATGGPVTITAAFGGLSNTAALTVTTAAPATPVTKAQLPFSGTVDASGVSRYRVSGLLGVEYLASLTSTNSSLSVEVDADASFLASVCSASAGPPPCRAGNPSAAGDLFALVSGDPGAAFTLDVSPLPVFQAGGAGVSGTVDSTETYYKVTGLAPGFFGASLGGLLANADLVVYDGPNGSPLGSTPVLCDSRNGADIPTESCRGTVPASGVVYVTVEGWLTLAGTPFTLNVVSVP
jgi:hypothetical protein